LHLPLDPATVRSGLRSVRSRVGMNPVMVVDVGDSFIAEQCDEGV
jgi:hypothetical protein